MRTFEISIIFSIVFFFFFHLISSINIVEDADGICRVHQFKLDKSFSTNICDGLQKSSSTNAKSEWDEKERIKLERKSNEINEFESKSLQL